MVSIIAGVLVMLLAACSPLESVQDYYPGSYLVVCQFPEIKELGRYGLDRDNRFSLSFIHSVSATPVMDSYDVVGKKIIQKSEIFLAHGAGLPSNIEEPGGVSWIHENKKFCLYMERPIEKLVVRTDKNYKNRLDINGRIIDLNQWEDQALLIFVDRCNTR